MPRQKKAETAIAMLREDHRGVKALFKRFEAEDSKSAKRQIAADALMQLKLHATIEEELFYPALRQRMEDPDGLLDEADEEHHVAKILIAELEQMKGDEDHWEAKFKVLAESVRHRTENGLRQPIGGEGRRQQSHRRRRDGEIRRDLRHHRIDGANAQRRTEDQEADDVERSIHVGTWRRSSWAHVNPTARTTNAPNRIVGSAPPWANPKPYTTGPIAWPR